MVNLCDEQSGAKLRGFFVMHVVRMIYCVDYNKTRFKNGSGYSAAVDSAFELAWQGEFAIKKGSIPAGDHIWLPTKPLTDVCFISDKLRHALIAAGMHGWSYAKCFEGD